MHPRLTAVLLTVAALLVAGCGGDVDKDKAQEQIKAGIAAQGKADVKYVKCPGGVKAEKGATFQCEALIPVNVTQVDENGNIRWQITSFSGPPTGTTGATGATGATGLAGATPPGGAAAGGTTGPAGGGAVADDPRFEKFTNRSQSYSISHPILWKRVGSGRDVNFPFPDGTRFIHIVIQEGKGLPTIAETRKSLRNQLGIAREVKKVRRDTVGNQPVTYAEYEIKLGNLPQKQVIKRYVFARGNKRALIELGVHKKLANKKPLLKKFDRSISSFRWLGSGT
jgi:Domain of unknown function (DUF4333)